MVDRQQAWLVRAAVELGLRVETDYVVTLPTAGPLKAVAFFPDLSSDTGIAVFPGSLPIDTQQELHREGHNTSIFDEPGADEEFDVETYAEMFAEWGWSGPPDDRPAWMDEVIE